MRAAVGSLDWLRETNGMLRPTDHLRLLGQGILLEVRALPAELRRALGFRSRRLARFDHDRFRVPDSSAAREAERL
jgi:hypothetical protein